MVLESLKVVSARTECPEGVMFLKTLSDTDLLMPCPWGNPLAGPVSTLDLTADTG